MTIRKRLFVGLLGVVLAVGSMVPFFKSDAANAYQQNNVSKEYQLPSSKFPDSDIREGKGEFADEDVISASGKQIAGPCTFAINPTSASYAAGGGTGSVSVTADAAGCNWTAVSNATFITITSGASGAGNGTANYSVAANTGSSSRNGTMTIAGLTFTVNQAGTGGGTNLIVNPGFETGTTPWVISGSTVRSTGAFPHSGVAYMILGVNNSSTSTLYQTVTVPGGGGNLNFWLNITTSEAPGTISDRLFIEVRSTSGMLLATLTTFSNVNSGTAGVYVLRGPYNLSAFAGQTVRIQFRGTNDITLPTSFRVDDVSVQ